MNPMQSPNTGVGRKLCSRELWPWGSEEEREKYQKWQRDFGKSGGDKCLHDACEECHGTGIKKKDGSPCVHMISCRCKKCSNTSL